MTDRWYYAHDENKVGPCSDQKLRDLADSGQILRTDTIFKEGIEKGMLAGNVKNLFPFAAAVAAAVSTGLPITKVHRSPPAAAISPLPTGPATPPADLAAEPDRVEAITANPPAEPNSGPKTAPPANGSSPAMLAADPAPTPLESVAAPHDPRNNQPKAKKGRAIAGKGAIIVGQDGAFVKLKKKCTECGTEDSSRTTMPIRSGVNKTTYFCPKCRKIREVFFQGFSN